MLKRPCILFLLVPMLACGGAKTGRSSPTAPSPAAPSTGTFTFSGQVISRGTGIPDATVTVVNSGLNGADAGKTTTTDRSGHFSFTDMKQSTIYVSVSAVEHFSNNAPLDSNQPRAIVLVWLGQTLIQPSGQVIDAATSAPIGGATVDINGRYRTTTDAFGKYSFTGRLDIRDSSIITSFADGYESHTRYIRGNSAQSFRLRPVERIVGGQSWSVTVHPDDSLCSSDFYEPSFGLPGSGFRCRAVRVMAKSDGMLHIEAVSTVDGSRPPLDVTVLNNSGGPWDQRTDNSVSIPVRTGTELLVNVVGMSENASTSQSFIVTTSMSP